MTLRIPWSLPLLLVATLVAGCSGAAVPTTSPTIPPSPSTAPASTRPTPAAVGLLVRVTSEGGFIAPAASLAAVPTVSVTTDGRILTPGAVPAIYPGPLVPTLDVRDIGPEGAAAIATAIRAAGLDRVSSGSPGIPGDTGTTVFTVVLDGQTTTTRFAQAGPGGPGLPGASSGDPARDAAFALLDRLMDPAEAWGRPPAQATTYAPAGYRVFVAPGGPPPDPQASQAPADWPLATPLAAFGAPAVPDRGIAGLRTGIVLGEDAVTLRPFLARLTVLTPVVSDGKSYTLFVRPLLPDEVGG